MRKKERVQVLDSTVVNYQMLFLLLKIILILSMFFFFVFLLFFAQSQLTSFYQYTSGSVTYISVTDSHILVTQQGANSSNYEIIYFDTSTQQSTTLTDVTTSYGMAILVTKQQNTIQNNRLLYFDGSSLYAQQNNLTTTEWNTGVVVTSMMTSDYQIYSDFSNQVKFMSSTSNSISATIAMSYFTVKLKLVDTVLYCLSVQSGVQGVISWVSINTFTIDDTLSFDISGISGFPFMDVSEDGNYLAYSLDKILVIVDTNSKATVNQIQLEEIISQFAFVSSWILVTCSNGYIYQYNYLTKNYVGSGAFGQDQDQLSIQRTRQNVAVRNNQQKKFYLISPLPENSEDEGFFPVELSTAAGYTLMIGSWKSTTKGVFPFICMLEDFWYYKFHRQEYPQFMQFFMEDIDLINELRLQPNFIKKEEIDVNVFNDLEQNQIYKNEGGFQEDDDPSNIYFVHSSKEIYIWNLVLNLTLFLFVKIMIWLFYYFRRSFKCFRVLYNFFKYKAKWWVLIVMVLESNLLRLTFNSFLQFYVSGSYHFGNKVNFILTVFTFFIVFAYSTVFYILLYRYLKKKSESLLAYTKFSLRSFIFQMIIITWRNLLKGIAHSFFIEYHKEQLISLICVDVFLFIVFIANRKSFVQKIMFVICLCYSGMFIIFDSTLLARYQNLELAQNLSYDEMVKVQIICIFSLSLLQILILMGQAIQQIFAYYKNKKVLVLKSKEIKHRTKKQKIQNQKEKQGEEKKQNFGEKKLRKSESMVIQQIGNQIQTRKQKKKETIKKTVKTKAVEKQILQIIFQEKNEDNEIHKI